MKRLYIIAFFVLCATMVYAQESANQNADSIQNTDSIYQESFCQLDSFLCIHTLIYQQINQLTEIDHKQKLFLMFLIGLVSILFILAIYLIIRIERINNSYRESRNDETRNIIQWGRKIADLIKEGFDNIQKTMGEGNVTKYDSETAQFKVAEQMKDLTLSDDSGNPHIKMFQQETSTRSVDDNPSSKSNKLYALSIDDGRFVIINDNHTEDAIFELSVNDDGQTASVTIFNRAYQKVLSDPGAYLRGCDKNVWGNSQVNIIDKGTAEQSDDGKWMVDKKIKVELK